MAPSKFKSIFVNDASQSWVTHRYSKVLEIINRELCHDEAEPILKAFLIKAFIELFYWLPSTFTVNKRYCFKLRIGSVANLLPEIVDAMKILWEYFSN